MIVIPLGSGSGGNCYFFESDGTRVLVDAGFGTRETRRRLAAVGRSIEDIDAILVTHEHSDHIHGAERISRKYDIPVRLTRGTLDASRIDRTGTRVVCFENDSAFRVGEILVHAKRTIHDAADPACFVMEARDGSRVGFATDLGMVDPGVLRHLSGCDALLFESNHDLDMLRTGSYPWGLKRRIMSARGHLSNEDSMAALRRMIGAETSEICLIHLSEKNNHPSIVRSMAEELVKSLGADLRLQIAAQRGPTSAIRISRTADRPPPPPIDSPPRQMALF